MFIHRFFIYFTIKIGNEKRINTLMKEKYHSNVYLILKRLTVKQRNKED